MVTARVFCVHRCSFTSTSNSGRRQRRLTWSRYPRGAHLLMLQGREINPLFLSPAPGIDPGSAGVRLQCFTHRPRDPTIIIAFIIVTCRGSGFPPTGKYYSVKHLPVLLPTSHSCKPWHFSCRKFSLPRGRHNKWNSRRPQMSRFSLISAKYRC